MSVNYLLFQEKIYVKIGVSNDTIRKWIKKEIFLSLPQSGREPFFDIEEGIGVFQA